MTDDFTTQEKRYQSLEDIRRRKDELRQSIRQEDQEVRKLWSSLFYKPDHLLPATPTKRISNFLTNSAGIIDGLILGWKLYRKFKGNKRYKR